MLTDEVIVGTVIHVGLTGGHCVENLERADQFASGLQIDGKLAIGHGGDAVGDTLSAVVDTGKAASPGRDHGQGAFALRVSGCCECGCTDGGGTTERGISKE